MCIRTYSHTFTVKCMLACCYIRTGMYVRTYVVPQPEFSLAWKMRLTPFCGSDVNMQKCYCKLQQWLTRDALSHTRNWGERSQPDDSTVRQPTNQRVTLIQAVATPLGNLGTRQKLPVQRCPRGTSYTYVHCKPYLCTYVHRYLLVQCTYEHDPNSLRSNVTAAK